MKQYMVQEYTDEIVVVQDALNALAKDGWRVVSIAQSQSAGGPALRTVILERDLGAPAVEKRDSRP